MQIPDKLTALLQCNHSMDCLVKSAISQFEPWLAWPELPFFPEYTDHGTKHVEAVLRTAVGLASDEAWDVISAADAAVLTLSALLHDCAMHLTEDAFNSLLQPDRSAQCITGLGDKPWLVLWEEFLGEASRFDGRQLRLIFGDSEPVRRPPTNKSDYTLRDRLLIGEFLRRHHARLAQEIAHFGVAVPGADPLIVAQGASNGDIIELAAVVARSHGTSVRSLIPFLSEHYSAREYRNAHPVFLMALLRVADYLQIASERAPREILQIKTLVSPTSRREWDTHASIRDIQSTHEDPESIFVDALPSTVGAFVRVQEWLRGIQAELDASWAVIGEVYGRYGKLRKLTLLLRRVRSSIDEVHALARRVDYLPIAARFRTSDADLLKLLVAPLYGQRPDVGIRELIQNSVDAVRELRAYSLSTRGVATETDSARDFDVRVAVSSDAEGRYWVTVEDRGIGMTARTITHYFLTAGASYRRSEEWRKRFEGSGGEPTVLRAGRFGIGALAVFLLGSTFQVATRHVNDDVGVEFTARIDSDIIELQKCQRDVGTTVRVQVSAELANALASPGYLDDSDRLCAGSWDWYCYESPAVRREAFGTRLSQRHRVPQSENELTPVWRSVGVSGYPDVFWTYSYRQLLVVNGIEIRPEGGEPWRRAKVIDPSWDTRFGLTVPTVVVRDPAGTFPLNLQRNKLTQSAYPFDDELAESVQEDELAHAIVSGPHAFPQSSDDCRSRYEGSCREGLAHPSESRTGDYYFCASGFGLCDKSVLQASGRESLLVIRSDRRIMLEQKSIGNAAVVFGDGFSRLTEFDVWLRGMIFYAHRAMGVYDFAANSRSPRGCERVLDGMFRRGGRLLLSKWAFERMISGTSKTPQYLTQAIRVERELESHYVLCIGDCPTPESDFASLLAAGENESIAAEIYLQLPETRNLQALTWLRVLGTAELPYDLQARGDLVRSRSRRLESMIECHRVRSMD